MMSETKSGCSSFAAGAACDSIVATLGQQFRIQLPVCVQSELHSPGQPRPADDELVRLHKFSGNGLVMTIPCRSATEFRGNFSASGCPEGNRRSNDAHQFVGFAVGTNPNCTRRCPAHNGC